MLPSLQFFVRLQEFFQICIYLKFVRIWVGLLALAELLNLSTSYFIILLETRINNGFSAPFPPKKKKGCQKQRTFGVRLLSSSSAETCLSGLAGPAAAFSLFFSSLARCFCLFLSSLLLKELSIDAGNQWVV